MTTFDSTNILIEGFSDTLVDVYLRLYTGEDEYIRTLRAASSMALEVIATSDALYHNVEHSIMVTLVGQEILRGKQLRDGTVDPRAWVHFIVSLLCHDIGYVRGVCPGDTKHRAVIDEQGTCVDVPTDATDAFLTPYHVERGKLFVKWRFKDHPLIKAEIIAKNIEHTRFPVPDLADNSDTMDYPALVRAADLIGQLADPGYLRKLPALFYEFEETGANQRLGYTSPDDVRRGYPNFFWGSVKDHIEQGLEYLRITREGRQWQANLYAHIFSEEHRMLLAL